MSTELPKVLPLLPGNPGMSAPLPLLSLHRWYQEQKNKYFSLLPSFQSPTIGRAHLEASWYGSWPGKCCLQASSSLWYWEDHRWPECHEKYKDTDFIPPPPPLGDVKRWGLRPSGLWSSMAVYRLLSAVTGWGNGGTGDKHNQTSSTNVVGNLEINLLKACPKN